MPNGPMAASRHLETPTLRNVPTDAIDVDVERLRTTRHDADITVLAESIRANGLVHPLIIENRAHGRFRLIAGHRRLAALRRLRAAAVPALVLDPENELHRLSIQVVENVQRRALSPYDRRIAYLRLRDLVEGNTGRAASMLGIHPASFRRVVREDDFSAPRSVVRLSLGQTLKSLERWNEAAPRLSREKRQLLYDKAVMLVATLQVSLEPADDAGIDGNSD
jgi:ParB/RepB/Spo0J family partition protein